MKINFNWFNLNNFKKNISECDEEKKVLRKTKTNQIMNNNSANEISNKNNKKRKKLKLDTIIRNNKIINKILVEYVEFPIDYRLNAFNDNYLIFKENKILFGKNNIYFKQDIQFSKEDFYLSTRQTKIKIIDKKFYIKCLGINYYSRVRISPHYKFIITNNLVISNIYNEYLSFHLTNPIDDDFKLNFEFFKLKYLKIYKKRKLKKFSIKYWSEKVPETIVENIKFKEEEENISDIIYNVNILNFNFRIIKDNGVYYIVFDENIKLYFLIKSFKNIKNKKHSHYLEIYNNFTLKLHFHSFLIKFLN